MGRRRNPNWSDPGAPYSFGFEGGVGKELTHEFTGHTALDHFDLVHMGGRVHDPVLGRVLSPDPFLPAPDSTQGLNRYSYVSNNPLSITDPSGYFGDGGNVSFGSDVGFGGSSVLGPGVLFQFESYPVLQGAPSSGSVGEASSFSFNVEFSASGLQPGVSQHPFGFIFGSFAEGAFSVFQLPLPTFNPLGHFNPNPLVIHLILTEPFGLPAPIPPDTQVFFRLAFSKQVSEPEPYVPPCTMTPFGPCRSMSMDPGLGHDLLEGGGWLGAAKALAKGGTSAVARTATRKVAESTAKEAAKQPGRGLDDILKRDELFTRWLKHKHPADRPLSVEDARRVWDKLKSLKRKPRIDPGHPGTKWDRPPINVDGHHIAVDPAFVP